MTEQLNLLGLPVTWAPVTGPALSSGQREIVRLARRPEGITGAEAGRIVHSARDDRNHRHAPVGGPCCQWMSSDGWSALQRLRVRGFVHQPVPRGPYFAGRHEPA